MTGHDPVCTVKPAEAIKAADCWRCKLIAQARADEREKAAQRVESCVNKFKARDYNDAVDACAAAVRGAS